LKGGNFHRYVEIRIREVLSIPNSEIDKCQLSFASHNSVNKPTIRKGSVFEL
jgi:hypothetical protein